MKNVIYYFTGSGNSLYIAKKIASALGDTKLLSIKKEQQAFDTKGYERVGIIFPIYYDKMPVFVESFIKKIKIYNNQYLFGLATFGGLMGMALEDLRARYNSEGFKLNGEFGIRMPGNNIVEYGALPNIINNFILSRSEKKIDRVITIIKEKKGTKQINAALLKALYGNSENGKVFLEKARKNFLVNDKKFTVDGCNSCGICEKVCPVQNIKLENGNPVWQHQCEQCMGCIQWCPKGSIHIENSDRKRYHHSEVKLKEMLTSEIIIK